MKSMGLGVGYSRSFERRVIHYARHGRILNVNKLLVFFQIVICFIISLVFILNIESISHVFVSHAIYLIKDVSVENKEITNSIRVFYIKYDGRFPSIYEVIIYIFSSVVGIFLAKRIKFISQHIIIYIQFLFFILLCSSMFFYFIPYKFPYDSTTFSVLYILTQVLIFSFIPAVLGLSLALFNVSLTLFLTNFIVIGIALIYSFVFGVVRYVVMLFILNKFSYIWMANLFFNLGPLLDMIYISGVYSIYISIISDRYRKFTVYWRWIY